MKILIYILKVWLLTMILAPFISLTIIGPGKDFWYYYIIILSTSLLISIPVVLIMVLFMNCAPDNWSKLKIKILNSVIAAAAISITFILMDKSFLDFSEQVIIWPLSYAITMIIFIFIFKLNRKNKAVQNA